MTASSRESALTGEAVAREAYALAKVLRLLGRAPGQAGESGTAADPELAQIAEQLDMIASTPEPSEQMDSSLVTLDRALELAEQTVIRLKREVQGNPLRRLGRALRRGEDQTDPAHLADALVARLQQQHKVIASQGGH
jgi:hypothetical protein